MGCVARYGHFTHLLVVTVIPLVLIGVLNLVAIVNKGNVAKGGSDHRAQIFNAVIMITFCVLPSSSCQIFRTFHCKSFDENNRFLVADLAVDCDSGAYSGMLSYAVLMLVVYPIGGPLFYLYLLHGARDKINPKGADTEFDAIAKRSMDTTLAAIKPLFSMYRPGLWFFEVIDMLRRIVLMGVFIFVEGQPTRAAVGFMFALVVAAVWGETTPYAATSVNSLATMANWMVRRLVNVLVRAGPFLNPSAFL